MDPAFKHNAYSIDLTGMLLSFFSLFLLENDLYHPKTMRPEVIHIIIRQFEHSLKHFRQTMTVVCNPAEGICELNFATAD